MRFGRRNNERTSGAVFFFVLLTRKQSTTPATSIWRGVRFRQSHHVGVYGAAFSSHGPGSPLPSQLSVCAALLLYILHTFSLFDPFNLASSDISHCRYSTLPQEHDCISS